MPTSGNRGNVYGPQARRTAFRMRGRSARSVDAPGEFLHIAPAPGARRLGPRTLSSLAPPTRAVSAAPPKPSPDRLSLDRRGLSGVPVLEGGAALRLVSLQHNLLTSLAGLAVSSLPGLVFLDLYDNQIERVCSLEPLANLRVLLMGKNRIRQIEGLSHLGKLEVLDLHGNRITELVGLEGLEELKVLNLAGNLLRLAHLPPLPQLRELNLKRNRLRRLLGCQDTPLLQKLFLSNNDLQSIEDISSVALAQAVREVTLDNNPVALGGDCVSFLVSYLPGLAFLSAMRVTEQVRRAAATWRHNKEAGHAAYGQLGEEADATAHRDQVISNARTNWELLRTQSKCLATTAASYNRGLPSEFVLEAGCLTETHTADLTSTPAPAPPPASTTRGPDRRVNFSARSHSRDTDCSHSTSTSSELLRLPPIAPTTLERQESVSSADPAVDSSPSSLPTTASESESETRRAPSGPPSRACRRRAAFATRGSASVSEADSDRLHKASRTDSASETGDASTGTGRDSVVTDSSTSGGDRRLGRAARSAGPRRPPPRAALGRAFTARPRPPAPVPAPPPAPAIGELGREQGGDWLVEVRGGQASVWGAGALRRLERAWPAAADVMTVNFHYVSFGSVAGVLSTVRSRFPNAVNFAFRACGVSCAGQLGALAALRGVSSLAVHREGNPLAAREWHSYALYRLAHWGLRTLDHREVPDEEIAAAHEEYAGLSEVVLRSLPDTLLRPLLLRLQGEVELEGEHRSWLGAAEPALRGVVAREALQWRRGALSQDEVMLRHRGRAHVARVLALATGAAVKLRLLRRQWPSLLLRLVTEVLLDYSHGEAHARDRLRELSTHLTPSCPVSSLRL